MNVEVRGKHLIASGDLRLRSQSLSPLQLPMRKRVSFWLVLHVVLLLNHQEDESHNRRPKRGVNRRFRNVSGPCFSGRLHFPL